MAQPVTTVFCGMEGTGETAAKAKLDAQRRIEAVMAGDWTPHVLSHKGYLTIVARQPNRTALQWDFQTVQASEGHRPLHLSGNHATREEALVFAACHLAQLTSTYEGLEAWITLAQQRILDHYFKWQVEYASARSEGLSDEVCRQRADAAQNAGLHG